MYSGTVDEELYTKMMNRLKEFSKSYDDVLAELDKYRNKDDKNVSNRYKRLRKRVKKEGLAGIVVNSFVGFKTKRKHILVRGEGAKWSEKYSSDYFSNQKIAVYTAVFGNYDNIKEPVIIPDNCDFYIVTNQDVPEESIWKKVDISKFDSDIKNLTNKEKNLYFRSHPDLLFKDYEYSIYLDGNIMPITDLTELVNYIDNCGIGMFRHPDRQCIYDECNACMYFGMISSEAGERHIDYLERNHMPHNYGLLETGIIARKHNLYICKKVMDDWWNEFIHSPRRDQLSFTYALYKNDISVEEVALPYKSMTDFYGIKKFSHKLI